MFKYAKSLLVPMMAAGVGVSRQKEREDTLVNTVDFYATISQALGFDASNETDSVRFYDVLCDFYSLTRDYNCSECVGTRTNGWTVRNDDYKLLVNADERGEQCCLQGYPRDVTNLISQFALYEDQ